MESKKLIGIVGFLGMFVLIAVMYKSFFNSNEQKFDIEEADPFAALKNERDKEPLPPDAFERVLNKTDDPVANLSETKKEEPKHKAKKDCDSVDQMFGRCRSGDAPESDYQPLEPTEINKQQHTRHVSFEPIKYTSENPEPERKVANNYGWAKFASTTAQTLNGRSSLYHGDVIRAGCRVLGVVQDELAVETGENHQLTINVRGPLNGCTLPNIKSLRLIGDAKLSRSGNKVRSTIKTCADTSSRRRSVNCSAVVKSITGADGLEGEIYDNSGWGILMEFALSVGAAPVIGKLMETAATSQTMWGAEASAQIASSLHSSVDRIAQKISRAFEGREIKIAQNAVVIVSFNQDVAI